MNENLGLLLTFLFLALPLFAFIFFVKCVDLCSYRKLGMTDKIKKHLLLELLILIVAQLLTAIAQCLIWNCTTYGGLIFLALLWPPSLPILSLILMYLLERKGIPEASQKHSLKTKCFVVNLILAFVLKALNAGLLYKSIFPLELGMWGSSGKTDGWSQKETGALVLIIIILVLIKLIVQKVLVKRASTIAAKG